MTGAPGGTAWVTGASRGIGLAIARALVESGVSVIMVARSADLLARESARLGPLARALVCDLTDAVAIEQTLGTLEAPDVLVNNAGAFALGRIGELPVGDAATLLTTNLISPFRLLSLVIPRMRERGSGHVVTIGSVADRVVFPENAAYAASKFGARAMHQALRDETRGSGVRVSLVSPAAVDTPLWDPIHPESRPGFPLRAEMLRPDDVAAVVMWVLTRPPHVNIDELRLGAA